MPTKISTITVNELGYGASAAASAAAASASEAAAATYADVAWPGQAPGNRIINGNFDIWQRGTSFDASGVVSYSADRWNAHGTGGTHTVSRQDAPAGTLFGGAHPQYVLRSAQSAFNATTGVGGVQQRIENVRSYSGQTLTLLGWARRVSGSGNLQVEYEQDFGSGGSSAVRAKAGDITLTTSWAAFAVTINVPAVTGKTVGAGSFLGVNFWANVGTGSSPATAGGCTASAQDITFELGGVHILPGTHTTSAADNYPGAAFVDELARCQRYYWKTYNQGVAPGAADTEGVIRNRMTRTGTFNSLASVVFPVTMREPPTVTPYNPSTGTSGEAYNETAAANVSISPAFIGNSGFYANIVDSTSISDLIQCHFVADAEL